MCTESQGNWSRGGLEYIESCPACGESDRALPAFKRGDDGGTMPDRWNIARCNYCSSLWLDPRPDHQSLPRAYDDYYTHNAESENIPQYGTKGIAWKLIHGYLNQRFNMQRLPASKLGYPLFSLLEPWRLKLDYYGRHLTHANVGKPGRLLDIGCGNGAFLARAAEMGWRVQGCEIDPKAVAKCNSLGFDVFEGDAFHPDLPRKQYDVITMSHVLEHIAEPKVVIQQANDLLRPGGWLWLALPNPNSIGLHISNSAWHGLHPPYHLSIPSQNVLKSWLSETGFTNIRLLRRGAHVRSGWRISQSIALREGIPAPSARRIFVWRIIADALATVSSSWAEETVLLAQKPELIDASK
tara:strand:+ start:5983 stop:7044 length:1062 start_codon:yes stop_codon:yes gene_type:complete